MGLNEPIEPTIKYEDPDVSLKILSKHLIIWCRCVYVTVVGCVVKNLFVAPLLDTNNNIWVADRNQIQNFKGTASVIKNPLRNRN